MHTEPTFGTHLLNMEASLWGKWSQSVRRVNNKWHFTQEQSKIKSAQVSTTSCLGERITTLCVRYTALQHLHGLYCVCSEKIMELDKTMLTVTVLLDTFSKPPCHGGVECGCDACCSVVNTPLVEAVQHVPMLVAVPATAIAVEVAAPAVAGRVLLTGRWRFGGRCWCWRDLRLAIHQMIDTCQNELKYRSTFKKGVRTRK